MKPTSYFSVVRPPSDPQAKIWRYMDFAKLVATLEHAGLFFARCSTFKDPFEGSWPRGNKRLRHDSLAGLGLSSEDIEIRLASRSQFYKWSRQYMLASCWHLSHDESEALWSLYGESRNAVGIQTTYRKLKRCLPSAAHVGKVKYIDYDTATLEEGNALFPFFRKRRSFAHEKELRALISDNDWPRTTEGFIDTFQVPADSGRWVNCNLAELIETIWISPTAELWFKGLVEGVVAKYGLATEVRRSSLHASPYF